MGITKIGPRSPIDWMESKFWGAYRFSRAAKIRDGGSLTLISGFLSDGGGAIA
jgi:hypothetical protein